MSLVLQQTSVQVKYWNYTSLTKKQVEEVLFIKAQQQSRQKDFYRDLTLKLDKSSTQAVSVENYKIRLFKYDYTHILKYLCRVFFSHNPKYIYIYIYIDYFKSRHDGDAKEYTCILWLEAKIALVRYSLCKSYCVFTLRVLWPKSFLIFIVDELKKFAANNLP